jgi:hypothetical protein
VHQEGWQEAHQCSPQGLAAATAAKTHPSNHQDTTAQAYGHVFGKQSRQPELKQDEGAVHSKSVGLQTHEHGDSEGELHLIRPDFASYSAAGAGCCQHAGTVHIKYSLEDNVTVQCLAG